MEQRGAGLVGEQASPRHVVLGRSAYLSLSLSLLFPVGRPARDVIEIPTPPVLGTSMR